MTLITMGTRRGEKSVERVMKTERGRERDERERERERRERERYCAGLLYMSALR